MVQDGHVVLSNVVHSQISLHQRFRGVVPELASRSHTERILPIVSQALADAKLAPADLTAIAVTHRPGMVGCLLVGLAAAKALAWRFNRPLVGVDHVQAHVHTGLLVDPGMPLPALCLVASGGHTALYKLIEPGKSERLGTTRDDAAGEAFDKGAALLGLSYPGGPSIENEGKLGDRTAFKLPRTMLDKDSLDFSFSGMKTALLYTVQPPSKQPPGKQRQEKPKPEELPSGQELKNLAASYQEAIVDVLVGKLRRAAEQHDVQSLCIGGGVAKNIRLRERIANDSVLQDLHLVLPPLDLCADNGAMIAGLGSILFGQGKTSPIDLDAVATAQSGGKIKMRPRKPRRVSK